MTGNEATRTDLMTAALDLMRRAIDLLDQAEAPGQIAAHVDLAVHQLADAIADTPRPKMVEPADPQFRTLPSS
jgi:hypothetical protein